MKLAWKSGVVIISQTNFDIIVAFSREYDDLFHYML